MVPAGAQTCPTPHELSEYARGHVSPRVCELVSRHLTDCPQCLESLQQLPTRAVEWGERLQQPVSTSGHLAELDCQKMLEQLRQQSGRHTVFPSGETSRVTLDPTPNAEQMPDAQHAADNANLPRSFGRYRLVQVLGRGGMGTVYRAYDPQLDREIALKIPRFTETGAARRERFFREARTSANIVHPHICPIYDVGEVDGTPFLTMRLITGESLSQRLKQGTTFSPGTAVTLVMQLAHALEATHRRGIVHRDLKPANILLDEHDHPLLTDFGLAQRIAPTEAEITQSGEIFGTPAYMSPEQIRGEHALIGPATDIYSLGCVLFELLTGERPCTGSPLEIVAAVLRAPVPSVLTINPEIPPELDRICQTALSKSIADRYPSMQAFAEELAGWQAQQQADAQTPPIPPRRAAMAGGRWWGLGAVALLCAGLVLVFSESRGAIEFRVHDQPVRLQLTKPDGTTKTLVLQQGTTTVAAGPGEYRVELLETVETIRIDRDRFQLERGGNIIVEVQQQTEGQQQNTAPRPVPPTVPFAFHWTGATPVPQYLPVGQVPDWEHPNVFAELRSAGALEYPVLPATSYVLESEWALREPGCYLHFQALGEKYRVWARFDWDEAKGKYRCKLQRFHGRGTWFINWHHFEVNQRIKLRFVMHEGMALLYEGDRLLLNNPSIAVPPQIRIAFGGESARNGTIYRCELRPPTPAEIAVAAELRAKADAQAATPAITPSAGQPPASAAP